MSCPHQIDVGAYAIDALEPDERLLVRAHLEQCPVCAAELAELESLPALLASVPAPGVLPPAPVPSELAFHRLRRSAVGELPAAAPQADPAPSGKPPAPVASRSGTARPSLVRQWLLVAAAAVVLGTGGVTAAVITGDRGVPETVSARSGDLWVQAGIASAGSGTRITLVLNGIPAGQHCELTVEARDGHWETAGVWTADYDGDAHMTGRVAIPPQDVRRLVIRTPDGRTLLTMPS